MFAEESSVTDLAKPSGQFSIDSKAMRKVEVGQDIIVALETASAGGGAISFVGGRILIKTH